MIPAPEVAPTAVRVDIGTPVEYNDHSEVTRHVVANYVSRSAGAHWDAIRSFVVASVNQLEPQSPASIRFHLTVATRFALWLRTSTGASLDEPADYWTFHQVQRFAAMELGTGTSASYRAAVLRRLNTFVRRCGDGEDSRRAIPVAPLPPLLPYTSREQAAFLAAAHARGSEHRRSNNLAFVALGLGAGLRAVELVAVRVEDISDDCTDMNIHVRAGSSPRIVPMRREWCETLRQALASRASEDFVIIGHRSAKPAPLLSTLTTNGPKAPRPTASRMRATWIIGHLTCGLRIDLVLEIAGLHKLSALVPYVASLPAVSPIDRELAHGSLAND
ncbi:tyrosine-type recombinase/integrase [Leifsonia sp. Root4]|uniref:tyrosine-type recombinase/integrase n=1 Tax=Leifsonia sp. Root4 TaxID=1736525 RepID=UPI0009E6C8FD|nr:tyrosine-type recombinase/integrase [Leifsonia sp. Root4]